MRPVWSLQRVLFSETFSEAWIQNSLRWLLQKRHYSIVRIAPVRYVQAQDCSTRLHKTLRAWWLGFISLSFWYKLLYCLWIILSTLLIKHIELYIYIFHNYIYIYIYIYSCIYMIYIYTCVYIYVCIHVHMNNYRYTYIHSVCII